MHHLNLTIIWKYREAILELECMRRVSQLTIFSAANKQNHLDGGKYVIPACDSARRDALKLIVLSRMVHVLARSAGVLDASLEDGHNQQLRV